MSPKEGAPREKTLEEALEERRAKLKRRRDLSAMRTIRGASTRAEVIDGRAVQEAREQRLRRKVHH
eukprot:6776771-Pyramimonas_sp.AAC.1